MKKSEGDGNEGEWEREIRRRGKEGNEGGEARKGK